MTSTGLLAIISGPSGVGKSTLIKELVKDTRFALSVSATTRQPRPGEHDGIDYHFLDADEFRARIDRGEFLEYALVHGQSYYGTLASEVDRLGAQGQIAILDIDVQGAKSLAGVKNATSIFIAPPSWDELVQRLRGRASENETELQQRLDTAEAELQEQEQYDHVVINAELSEALQEIRGILLSRGPKNSEETK